MTKCTPNQRRRFVRKQCEVLGKHHPNNSHLLSTTDIFEMTAAERRIYADNLLVDDKHKLLLCSNAKVGATTYKFLLASHVRDNHHTTVNLNSIHSDKYLETFNLKCMGKYTDAEIIERLRSYHKVVTVRDPLLRVYSSYREKLATVKPPDCQPYQKSVGKDILNHFRSNLTTKEENCGYTVTFAEFMKYIAQPYGEYLLKNDAHWNEYYKKCHPCILDYDYYIRIETGDSDQHYFLNEYLHSNQTDRFSGNKIRFNNVGNTTEEMLAQNGFTQTPQSFAGVNRSDYDVIRRHFQIDSQLFGYSHELTEHGLTSTCRSTDDSDVTQCC